VRLSVFTVASVGEAIASIYTRRLMNMNAAPELAADSESGARASWQDGIANGAHFAPGDTAPDMDALMSEVEELAEQLRDAADSEIAQLGRQVEMMLKAVRQHVAAESDGLRERARRAQASEGRVHASLWPTLGLVALAAGAIAFITARR
jgi:ElaB/YqjD/DUF883 family membrane-anchored ribosome-binding protein